MKKNCTRFAIAAGVLAVMSATCPTASADATTWQMPDLTKTTLQKAFRALSGVVGPQEQLVLLQPGTAAPKNAPAGTLYVHPLIKGDAQPVYDMADWQVCYQGPDAGSTLTPQARIWVQIARPYQDCK
jgi:hypothetical protein